MNIFLSENSNIQVLCLNEHNIKITDVNYLNTISNFRLVDGFFRTTSHGGSCILVKENIQVKNRPDLGFLNEELIFEGSFVEIEAWKCIIISIYRTPGIQITANFLYRFKLFLQKIEKENKLKKVLIASDFNINILNNDSSSENFKNIVNQYGYKFCNWEPTRITVSSSSCIDNILISSNYGLHNSLNQDLSLSDHNALFITVPVSLPYVRSVFVNRCSIRIFESEAQILFLNKLNLALQDFTLVDSVEINYNNFLNKFILCMDEFFPVKSVNKVNTKQRWITKGIRISASRKRELHKELKLNNDIDFVNYVKKYRQIFKKVVSAAKKIENDKFILNSKNKPKATWTVVKNEIGLNNKMKNNNITLELIDKEVSSPVEVAELFNTHFTNIVSNMNIHNVNLSSNNFVRFNDVITLDIFNEVSVNEVDKIITSLSSGKTCGWDNIPMILLKLSVNLISPIITLLINQAFTTGVFPLKLKFSEIKPIYKKGSAKDISNYRPISILSNISKIFERAINFRLVQFLEANNIICNEQYGFRKNRNTELALSSFVDRVSGALDGSRSAAGVFCDLSKAFDCVNHQVLIKKMEILGIRNKALKLIKSYLLNRYQRTVIKNNSFIYRSKWSKISFGVPQGSVLGPTLFLIYINNLPSEIPRQFILFADDTNVLIRSDNFEDLEDNIVSTLSELEKWFEKNGLLLNHDKTNIIHFRAKNLAYNEINNSNLNTVNSHKFLGVHIDRNLNWKTHIEFLVNKLSTYRFAFKVLTNSVSKETCRVVYCAYIQSILKYGIIVWGLSPDFDKVFKAQKILLRVIEKVGFRHSCKQLFIENKLFTLPCLYIFEVLKFVHNNQNNFGLFMQEHSYNTRNKHLFKYPVHKLKLFERSPSYMGIKLYNKIPLSLKQLPESKFINTIKDFLLSKAYYSVDEWLCDNIENTLHAG